MDGQDQRDEKIERLTAKLKAAEACAAHASIRRDDSALRDKIAQLEAELLCCRDDVDFATKVSLANSNIANARRDEVSDLELKIARIETEKRDGNAELEDELKRVRKDMAHAFDLAGERLDAVTRRDRALATTLQERDDLRTKCQDLDHQVMRLSHDSTHGARSLAMRLEEATNERDVWREKCQDAEAESKQRGERIDELDLNVSRNSHAVKRLGERLEAATSERDALRAKCQAAEARSEALAYPDPTIAEIESRPFDAVWRAISGWDISRGGEVGERMYSSPTGNDVMHILNAIGSASKPLTPDKHQGMCGLPWARSDGVTPDFATDTIRMAPSSKLVLITPGGKLVSIIADGAVETPARPKTDAELADMLDDSKWSGPHVAAAVRSVATALRARGAK